MRIDMVAAPTRDEVMADTQETLRAVARALEALGPVPTDIDLALALDASSPLERLARFLAESYSELAEILEGLRETRGLFRKAEMHRLQHTHITLQEVTSQTEIATTGMLDGLERCLLLVDDLEENADAAAASDGAVKDRLRDEIHTVMQHLQFQDITAQRIGHATGVLSDVETRLVRLIGTLEQYGFTTAPNDDGEESTLSSQLTCDPNATTANADSRQAVADDIFA